MNQTNVINNHIIKIIRGKLLVSCLSATLFGLGMVAGQVAWAAEFQGTLKTVAITDAAGTNAPPVAVVSHTADGSSVIFNAGASTDPDGTIADYHWKFPDGTTLQGPTVTYQPGAQPADSSVTLTLTDNQGGVSINHLQYSMAEPVNIAVNFQPATSQIPSGYVMDSGMPYNATAGYGWVTGPGSIGTRDRNNSDSPDKAYDTLMHADPTAKWELDVPNGTYSVTVTMGDPSYPNTVQGLQVESISVISAEALSTSKKWITKQLEASVADGKLTLTFQTATVAKICWVRVVGK